MAFGKNHKERTSNIPGLAVLQFCAVLCALGTDSFDGLPSGVHTVDLDGKVIDPFASTRTNAYVFIFVSVECPISNSYMFEYQRLERDFRSVSFKLIYPNSDESGDAIRRHLKAFECTTYAMRDPQHDLVRHAKVKVTPEAAVFVPGRGLVYHGRIDNRYVELGKARPSATVHDLRDVLTAVSAGKPSPIAVRSPVGCYISGGP
jgi:hypothetical protein